MRCIKFLAPATVVLAIAEVSFGISLYEENFEVDPTVNWTVNAGPSDETANFFFDYTTVGIPLAPNSAPGGNRGMKLQANQFDNILGGFSVSPTGQSFSGDYRLTFDWWANFNGPFPDSGDGSSQLSTFGIGTSGTVAQWISGTQDSVWFAASGDGRVIPDWRAYSTISPIGTGYAPASGVFAAGTGTSPDARDSSHPYYAGFGSNSAPAAQQGLFPQQTGITNVGSAGMEWHEVEIEKQGTTVRWMVDGLLIATIDLNTVTLGGSNIFFGHSDRNNLSSADPNDIHLLFTLIDNVQVLPNEWALSGGGNWNNAANWTAGGVPNGALARAVLGGMISSSSIVSLDADITVSEIVFDNGLDSYEVADDGVHELTLAGDAVIDVAAGSHVISAPIVGTDGLHKTGPGTVTLSPPGTNTYSGVTQVSDGTLVVESQELPGESIEVSAGATLVFGLIPLQSVVLRPNQTLSGSGDVVVVNPIPPAVLDVAPTSAVRGTLTIQADEVRNSGLVAPGNSPGIIEINGDYVQTSDGVLEIEVGGDAPGTEHDQLVVSGTASLMGRLDVPFINLYTPTAVDEIIFLTAGEGRSGNFDSIHAPDLAGANPNNLAIEIDYNTNDVRLHFVAPSPPNIFNGGPLPANWQSIGTWGIGVPNTTSVVVVQNTAAMPRQVNVRSDASGANAFAHSVTVGGITNTMTVHVEEGRSLSATTGITINQNGIVALEEQSTLVTSTVEVGTGGLLAGNGTIVGNLKVGTAGGSQNATFRPGFSPGNTKITGDAEYGSGAVLEIDVDGTGANQFDTIEVGGELKPGGKLKVLAGLSYPTIAEGVPVVQLEIISAGSLASGLRFGSVETTGNEDIFFRPIYVGGGSGGESGQGGDASSGFFMGGYNEGDMNMDTFRNSLDIEKLALALRDPNAYFNEFVIDGAEPGDIDDNGRLDFDDIDEFVDLLPGGSGANMAAVMAALQGQPTVPEPASAVLLLGAACFIMTCRRRRSIGRQWRAGQHGRAYQDRKAVCS